jgi:hypothetical protein
MSADKNVFLGSRVVWAVGRISSVLIIVPPTLSVISHSIPVTLFIGLLFLWVLILIQMRGLSFGTADERGLNYTSWFTRTSASWEEISEISSSAISIRFRQAKPRRGTLIFNRFKFASRRAEMEVLQSWWIARYRELAH